MPCEWRHHLHVRLPSRGFDRWRGDATAVPDQLHQWAIVSPTVQEMSSMSRLSRNAGAVKSRTSWNPVQRWMVDSGCGNDLIDKHSARSLPKIPSPCSMVFHTANGSVSARTECPIYVKGIGRTISPYVLESTPDVLSLGRRCADEGFTFHWEGFSTKPTWTLPNGHVITLTTVGYIPYLGGEQCPAAPAGSSNDHRRLGALRCSGKTSK